MKKWVIDSLMPMVKFTNKITIDATVSDSTCICDIKYEKDVVSKIIWKENLFDTKQAALEAYLMKLEDEIEFIKYKLKEDL